MPIRITGGTLRGRLVASPKTSKTRPTGAKAREALFNILQDVSGFRVLDLFAGSGIVGIEFLSRGAGAVVAVEKNFSQARSLEASYRALGISDSLRLCTTDAMRFFESANLSRERFDFIYADPPFTEAYPDLRPFIGLLSPSGTAVFEVPSRKIPEWATTGRVRSYGESSLVFFRASL